MPYKLSPWQFYVIFSVLLSISLSALIISLYPILKATTFNQTITTTATTTPTSKQQSNINFIYPPESGGHVIVYPISAPAVSVYDKDYCGGLPTVSIVVHSQDIIGRTGHLILQAVDTNSDSGDDDDDDDDDDEKDTTNNGHKKRLLKLIVLGDRTFDITHPIMQINVNSNLSEMTYERFQKRGPTFDIYMSLVLLDSKMHHLKDMQPIQMNHKFTAVNGLYLFKQ
jgi:hypothetical protein